MTGSTRPLVHAPDCRWANVDERTFDDRPGWVHGKCRTCRATGWREDATPPAPPPPPASRYVCREHPDEPVSWKGTGCTRCAADRRRRTPNPDRDPAAGHHKEETP